MKIRNKRFQSLRLSIIGIFVLIPMILGASYFYIYLGVIFPDLMDYMEEPPSTDEFYPLNEINLTRLENMATQFEHLQERHIPINLSQTITYNTSTGDIISYHSTDNGALHTAENLVASCFRYASLPEGEEKTYTLGLIQKMFTGIRLLIEIPNGGLGPDYSGTKIGRFYAPPNRISDGNYTWMFDSHFRHFNGTGKYSNWRIRLYTSKDEIGGYFLALAAILKLVDDVPKIQKEVRLIILQAMEGFLSSFWQEMSGDGKPNGAHLQFPCYAQWKLLLTKMAIIASPENARYKQLYNYFLNKELKSKSTPRVNAMDNIDNYYSQYFENMVVLGLFLIENDQELLNLYFKNYDRGTYINYRGHRNAFLNAVYLAAATRAELSPSYNIEEIRWDILDQLWRFHINDLIPFDTTCGGQNQTVPRTELGGKWNEVDPDIAKWQSFVDNTAWGSSYQWLTYGLQDNVFDERYLKAATVEMMRPTTIIWNQNPFREDGDNVYNNTATTQEFASASFSLPYHMLLYFDYLTENWEVNLK